MSDHVEKVALNIRRVEKFTALRIREELDEVATSFLMLDEATAEDAEAFDQLIDFLNRIAERD
ncbi:hypothetical protein M3D75_02015 [Microbacterium enclense]|uniref:hypothetical protein n=1 Tax=Microbacterium enclense TaxID=993073 RepID=UPI0021A8D377|nr:hypothetical protein [Microbacterium enclense]MCT2084886.1 hypothetical protein [Microbacterium enclense]